MNHTMTHPGRRRLHGFTLVEAVAALVVIATIGSLSAALMVRALGAYSAVAAASEVHGGLGSALERIDRALREIPRLASTGGPDIDAVTATSVRWNTASGDSWFELMGDELRFAADGGPAATLLADVTTTQVRCFDEDGDLLSATLDAAAAADVRRIEVTLGVEREGIADTLRTRVFLRCTIGGGS